METLLPSEVADLAMPKSDQMLDGEAHSLRVVALELDGIRVVCRGDGSIRNPGLPDALDEG
jgi:hypothetical protein